MRRTLWCVALFLASAWFVFRVFIHPQSGGRLWDAALLITATQTWMDGGNPYDDAGVAAAWEAGGGVPGLPRSIASLPAIVAPSCFPVLVPFAMLPTAAGVYGWLAMTVALAALHTVALGRLLGFQLRDWRSALLAVWTLTSASLIIGLGAGQPAILAVSLAIFCLYLERHGCPILAGALLGVAIACKVQVAAPFAAYWLIRGRLPLVVAAAIVATTLAVIAVLRMEIVGVEWLTGWRANVAHAARPGGPTDFMKPFSRDDLVNLQLLVWGFWRNWLGAHLVAAVTTALLTVAATILLIRRRHTVDDLVGWSLFAVLMLLPVYHRTYDAAVLVVPAAWSIANLRGRHALPAAFNLVVMLPFVLPAFLPSLLIQRGVVPVSWESTWWWDVLVLPSRQWGLLLLYASLLILLARTAIAAAGGEVVDMRQSRTIGR